jgi:hypothetical protein
METFPQLLRRSPTAALAEKADFTDWRMGLQSPRPVCRMVNEVVVVSGEGNLSRDKPKESYGFRPQRIA